MKFTDCYAGEVGSVHDATVLKRSNLFKHMWPSSHQTHIWLGMRLGMLHA